MDISVKEEEENLQEEKNPEDDKNLEDTKAVSFQIPFLFLRTQKGKNLMDKMAALRTTKPLGSFSLYLFPIIGAVGFTLILFSAWVMLANAPVRELVRESGPFVHLLLPGLNPLVPIFYGWFALVVAMIVHEGSHGVIARYFKLKIKSSGLILLFILPIGAFVDIDEEELKKIEARKTGRVMAAGPMSNFVVALISLIGLMLVVSSMSPIPDGIGVWGTEVDGPAHIAGITPKDIILSIEDIDVDSLTDVSNALSNFEPGDVVSVNILHEGKEILYNVELAASDNSSTPFMGTRLLSPNTISNILGNYTQPRILEEPRTILIYLFLPTFSMGQELVPFSGSMVNFYTSPLGDVTFIIANTLFWLWFVNFNLAIFNALPLYPLDGGQALRTALQSVGSKRGWNEGTANRISTYLSLFIVGIIVSVFVGPYIFG
jgi:membrane-associated protease RseP (regulator of RpoE activity)